MVHFDKLLHECIICTINFQNSLSLSKIWSHITSQYKFNGFCRCSSMLCLSFFEATVLLCTWLCCDLILLPGPLIRKGEHANASGKDISTVFMKQKTASTTLQQPRISHSCRCRLRVMRDFWFSSKRNTINPILSLRAHIILSSTLTLIWDTWWD